VDTFDVIQPILKDHLDRFAKARLGFLDGFSLAAGAWKLGTDGSVAALGRRFDDGSERPYRVLGQTLPRPASLPRYLRLGGLAGSHIIARPLRSFPTRPAHSFSPSAESTLM
jgi:hypothetical protein